MTSWTTLRSVSTWLASYPARLRAKDGSMKHVLINANVFKRDGQFVHTRCFTSSISETVYEQLKSEMLRGRRAG
jgi:hypothetical protein